MDADTERMLLESIAAEKLVVLCGAGLSMAPPTKAPSAATVAERCRKNYLTRISQMISRVW